MIGNVATINSCIGCDSDIDKIATSSIIHFRASRAEIVLARGRSG